MDALEDPAFTHVGLSRPVTGEAARAVPGPAAAGPKRRRLATLLPWGLASVFAGVAAWLALRPSVSAPTTRTTLALNDFKPNDGPGDLRIAPNGGAFAVVFDTASGSMLALRRADEADFRVIPGAEKVTTVAFSPDGTWIAYGNPGEGLMKVAVSGGAPQPVIPDAKGFYIPLDWGVDGRILFSRFGDSASVRAVPSTGGAAVAITDGSAASGQFLPGGNVLLGVQGGVRFVDVGADTSWIVVPEGIQPRFLPETGQLLWVDDTGAMWAADFDPSSGSLGGRRGIVLDGVTNSGTFFARYDVSEQGTLVYSTGGSEGGGSLRRLVAVGLDGSVVKEDLDPRSIYQPRWSPDGRFVAYFGGEAGAAAGSDAQIYTYDMRVKSRPRRLTSDGENYLPVWSPDGTRLAFASRREGTDGMDLFVKTVNGDEPERLLLSLPGNQRPRDWFAPDSLLISSGPNREIWVVNLPREGSADSATAHPFFNSEDQQVGARLSPQGDLVAYQSNARGASEIYVRSFPTAGTPEEITEGGGYAPLWSADGKTLYYQRDGADSLWAARIDRGPPFAVVSAGPAVPWGDSLATGDLNRAGDRFVTTMRAGAASGETGSAARDVRYFVVTNWFAELRARLAGGG